MRHLFYPIWVLTLEASPCAPGVIARVRCVRAGAVPQSCWLLSIVNFVDGEFSRDDRCVERLAVSFDGHRLGTQDVVYKVCQAVLKTMKEKTEGHGCGDELKDARLFKVGPRCIQHPSKN